MEIVPQERSSEENYKLITGLIVPRPIAWITTLSPNGSVNLAPFSAYGLVTHKPPMLMVTVGRRDNRLKDTARNILANGEFVVNVPRFLDAETVHASSADLPFGESEVRALHLETTPSSSVAVPRLAAVLAAMECRLRDRLEYPDVDSTIFLAEVVRFHVRNDLFHDGKIDTRDLDPVARLGGPNYAGIGRFYSASSQAMAASTKS